jgi:hypothetical protein
MIAPSVKVVARRHLSALEIDRCDESWGGGKGIVLEDIAQVERLGRTICGLLRDVNVGLAGVCSA